MTIYCDEHPHWEAQYKADSWTKGGKIRYMCSNCARIVWEVTGLSKVLNLKPLDKTVKS